MFSHRVVSSGLERKNLGWCLKMKESNLSWKQNVFLFFFFFFTLFIGVIMSRILIKCDKCDWSNNIMNASGENVQHSSSSLSPWTTPYCISVAMNRIYEIKGPREDLLSARCEPEPEKTERRPWMPLAIMFVLVVDALTEHKRTGGFLAFFSALKGPSAEKEIKNDTRAAGGRIFISKCFHTFSGERNSEVVFFLCINVLQVVLLLFLLTSQHSRLYFVTS